MKIEITLDDNLSKEELIYLLQYLKIINEKDEIDIDRNNFKLIEDEILCLELGKGDVSLSDEHILDLDNIKEIVNINRDFDIDKLEKMLPKSYKYLNLNNLMLIDEKFFEKHSDYFDWDKIINIPTLSEDFIENNLEKMNIKKISSKTLSLEFLLRNVNKLDVPTLYLTNYLEEVLENIFNGDNVLDYLPFIEGIRNLEYENNLLDPYRKELRDIKLDSIIND